MFDLQASVSKMKNVLFFPPGGSLSTQLSIQYLKIRKLCTIIHKTRLPLEFLITMKFTKIVWNNYAISCQQKLYTVVLQCLYCSQIKRKPALRQNFTSFYGNLNSLSLRRVKYFSLNIYFHIGVVSQKYDYNLMCDNIHERRVSIALHIPRLLAFYIWL